MRLLDLFCGAGGAAAGYAAAGFEIVGVDNVYQKKYPYEFVCADAIEYLRNNWNEFDVIHASPPCKTYTRLKAFSSAGHVGLIEPVRRLLIESGKPYVIENVPGAPLVNPLLLCGSMFGLPLIRHRLFECFPVILFPPATCSCKHLKTMVGHGISSFANGATAICVAGHAYKAEDGRLAMGIDWMSRKELSEAIPPVYTEFIGKKLIDLIGE